MAVDHRSIEVAKQEIPKVGCTIAALVLDPCSSFPYRGKMNEKILYCTSTYVEKLYELIKSVSS